MSQLNLPAAWAMANLGSIAYIEMGQSPESASYNTVKEGLPFFQGKAEFQAMHPEIRKWCSAPLKTVGAGAILLSVRAPVGPTNLATETSCIGRGLAGIAAKSEMSQKYIFWYLRKMENWLAAQGTGSTFAAVSGQFVRDLEIPIAPVAEQTRIVEKLEELLTDLDAGVAELKAAQKKLAQYRQSLLKAAVDGSLTAEWRDQNTPTETGAQLLTRILQERRARWEAKQRAKFKDQGKAPPKDWQKKYPEPVQPDTSDLPELPTGWVWVTAEMLFAWESGDFLPTSAQLPGGFPVYGGNGVNGRHTEANVAYVTIIIGRVGVHCGNIYLTDSPAWVTDNAIYATSKLDLIAWQHAELAMRFANLGGNSKGGAQPFISQKILNDTFIALPPLQEQCVIATLYAVSTLENHDSDNAIELSLKQAAAQRQNILCAAFSGQLAPQDASDEPASVLLARIRAERADGSIVRKLRGPKARAAA